MSSRARRRLEEERAAQALADRLAQQKIAAEPDEDEEEDEEEDGSDGDERGAVASSNPWAGVGATEPSTHACVRMSCGWLSSIVRACDVDTVPFPRPVSGC